jgi:hypothetical protein
MELKQVYKAHCSGIGKILSDPKGKTAKETYSEHIAKLATDKDRLQEMNPKTVTFAKLSESVKKRDELTPLLESNQTKIELSKTCLEEVYSWLKSQPEFYNKRTNFRSKYTHKGNYCEPASIEYAGQYYGWGMVSKNEVTLENDYLIGTCDVLLAKSVEDIKNCWSEKTFPLFDKEIPLDGYGWQGQGYMELYDRPEFGLIYTLMDAPDYMVERECRGRMYELGMTDLDAELFDEVKAEMTYSHYRDELRIKRFQLNRDANCMDQVKERVELIRQFIKQI